MQCVVIMTQSIFFKILIIDTPWLAREGWVWGGVAVVSLKFDLRSAAVIAVPYVICKLDRVITALDCIWSAWEDRYKFYFLFYVSVSVLWRNSVNVIRHRHSFYHSTDFLLLWSKVRCKTETADMDTQLREFTVVYLIVITLSIYSISIGNIKINYLNLTDMFLLHNPLLYIVLRTLPRTLRDGIGSTQLRWSSQLQLTPQEVAYEELIICGMQHGFESFVVVTNVYKYDNCRK